VNLFSHSDQQYQWQTSVLTGSSPTGWAGRAADIVSSQNASNFPTFFSVAGNSIMEKRATTQQVALASGQTLDLTGCSTSATNQIRLAAFQSLVTMSTGVRLARVRQQRNGR
jgi:hypothetical protein